MEEFESIGPELEHALTEINGLSQKLDSVGFYNHEWIGEIKLNS